MQLMFRLMFAAVMAAALALFGGIAIAQPTKQIKLTEKHIQGFLAAYKEVEETTQKAERDKLDDEKLEAQLDGIAKKHGFANLDEYEDVVGNVVMIWVAIDPTTKQFDDPKTFLQKRLDEAMKDTTMPPEEKKREIEQLTEEVKMAQPIQYTENIELVKKHYDQIGAVLPKP